jgi:hypothetical protein
MRDLSGAGARNASSLPTFKRSGALFIGYPLGVQSYRHHVPDAAAVSDTTEQRGLAQKSIAVDNIVAQSQQEEAEATYLRSAGKTALLSGDIGAGADILGAVGKAVTGLGGPASVAPAGYDPNKLSSLY